MNAPFSNYLRHLLRSPSPLLFIFLAGLAVAQQPSGTPKPDPFQGFGHTSLDRPSGGKNSTPSALDKGAASPFSSNQTTFAPQTATQTGAGIVLSGNWQSHSAEASGGQTMKLADLRALMSGFGTAQADIDPHPDVVVYQGQRMDSTPGDNCRITYLMPLRNAEEALFHSRGISTVSRAVAPGLPDGLFLHTYDVRAGIYNRLIIVTDSARPEPQVVSIVLKAESQNYYPPPPFRPIARYWHTSDYVNTENRGQSGLRIDTRVDDERSSRHQIVVNVAGAPRPLGTSTWYVPEPLIKLILYCLQNQGGR